MYYLVACFGQYIACDKTKSQCNLNYTFFLSRIIWTWKFNLWFYFLCLEFQDMRLVSLEKKGAKTFENLCHQWLLFFQLWRKFSYMERDQKRILDKLDTSTILFPWLLKWNTNGFYLISSSMNLLNICKMKQDKNALFHRIWSYLENKNWVGAC